MHETNTMPAEVHFIYATRVESNFSVENVLSLAKLLEIRKARPGQFSLRLFFSGHPNDALCKACDVAAYVENRRVIDEDVVSTLGEQNATRSQTVSFVCGPPAMTDHLVMLLKSQDSINPGQVYCEKWW